MIGMTLLAIKYHITISFLFLWYSCTLFEVFTCEPSVSDSYQIVDIFVTYLIERGGEKKRPRTMGPLASIGVHWRPLASIGFCSAGLNEAFYRLPFFWFSPQLSQLWHPQSSLHLHLLLLLLLLLLRPLDPPSRNWEKHINWLSIIFQTRW